MSTPTRVRVRADQTLSLEARFIDTSGNPVIPTSTPSWQADPAYFRIAPSADGMICECTPTGTLGFSAVIGRFENMLVNYVAEVIAGEPASFEVIAKVNDTDKVQQAIESDPQQQAAADTDDMQPLSVQAIEPTQPPAAIEEIKPEQPPLQVTDAEVVYDKQENLQQNEELDSLANTRDHTEEDEI